MSSQNPFNPSFGGKPQYFFGREREISVVSDALASPMSPYRVLFFTGNRGCGKTALLERLSRLAADAHWLCVDVHSLGASEAIVRKLTGGDVKTSERMLEPTLGFAGASLKAGSVRSSSSRHYDAFDLTDVLLETCRSLKGHEGVFITVDEIQKIPEADMENICAAVQMSMRKGMPVALMLAGLPGSKEMVSSYKGCTFMKRVDDVSLDSLLVSETHDAFRKLLALVPDIEVEGEAVNELSRFSQGYPYLMQLIGFHTIEETRLGIALGIARVDVPAVKLAEPLAYEAFRSNVIEPTVEVLSLEQRAYLHAMGQIMDEAGEARTADVAKAMGKQQRQLSSLRARLIKKRVITEGNWGCVRYNLPMMRRYFTDPFAPESIDNSNRWKHE